MKIETDFNVVWSAWDGDSDPDENRVLGHGNTEREAINSLVEQLLENERR